MLKSDLDQFLPLNYVSTMKDSTLDIAPSKPRPQFLRALGHDDPPDQIEIDGVVFERVDIFKHDSWAATALYTSSMAKIVCKFNRTRHLFGFPMLWLGRILARRERRFLELLSDLENVPNLVGPVSANGSLLPNAVAHVFIEGRPVGNREQVNDEFFPALERTIAELHHRGMAYVDLHKSENIIVDLQGHPHLIDFQVSFLRPRNRFLAKLTGRIERTLQDLDRYHIKKHLTLKRPDVAGYTWHEFNNRNERPLWIKAHRQIAAPLRNLRRKLLVLTGIRKAEGYASSELFPELAARKDPIPLEKRLDKRAA